jgi:hypothetical protein
MIRPAVRRFHSHLYVICWAVLLTVAGCQAPTPVTPTPYLTATPGHIFSQGSFQVTLDSEAPRQWTYTITSSAGAAMTSIGFGTSGHNTFIPQGCVAVLPEGSAWTVQPGIPGTLVAPGATGASQVTFMLDCQQAQKFVTSGPWLRVTIMPMEGELVRIDNVVGPYSADIE